MYLGCFSFNISKSFGNLQLIPQKDGIRLYYTPIVDGFERTDGPGFMNLVLPLEAVGGILVTARAFLYGVESLDENIILQGAEGQASDVLVKLYRDAPSGPEGRLSGNETCWLRLVSGPSEEERRRIKLGPRDLLCIEQAFAFTVYMAIQAGTHDPRLVDTVTREINPEVAKKLSEKE